MDNNTDCDKLKLILGQAGISILFIISEILPFIKSIKSNSLLEMVMSIFKKDNAVQYVTIPSGSSTEHNEHNEHNERNERNERNEEESQQYMKL